MINKNDIKKHLYNYYMKSNQHMSGMSFMTTKDITKKDFMNFCEELSNDKLYRNICSFLPLKKEEGGLLYVFHDSDLFIWVKSIRFFQETTYYRTFYKMNCCYSPFIKAKPIEWPHIDYTKLDEWKNSDDILFNKGIKITTELRTDFNAPNFSLAEVKHLEPFFNNLGFKKFDKYPRKYTFKS